METFELDPAGDVTLVVGEQSSPPLVPTSTTGNKIYRIRVSSVVLKQASPVWRAMFTGSAWKENVTGTIHCPEDEPNSMLLLLRIAHLQLLQVPATMDTQSLCSIAVLCDKYDCVDLVRPRLNGWLTFQYEQEEEEWVLEPLNGHDVPAYTPGSLMIAWTFGKEKMLIEGMRRLVFDSKVVDTDEEVVKTVELVSGYCLKEEVLPAILQEIYLATCTAILQAVHTHLAVLISPFLEATSYKSVYVANASCELCDRVMLGSLLHTLGRHVSFEHGPKLGNCLSSFSEVMKAIWSADCRLAEDDDRARNRSHSNCRANVCDKLYPITRTVRSLLDGMMTARIKEHLRKQAARSGCPNE